MQQGGHGIDRQAFVHHEIARLAGILPKGRRDARMRCILGQTEFLESRPFHPDMQVTFAARNHLAAREFVAQHFQTVQIIAMPPPHGLVQRGQVGKRRVGGYRAILDRSFRDVWQSVAARPVPVVNLTLQDRAAGRRIQSLTASVQRHIPEMFVGRRPVIAGHEFPFADSESADDRRPKGLARITSMKHDTGAQNWPVVRWTRRGRQGDVGMSACVEEQTAAGLERDVASRRVGTKLGKHEPIHRHDDDPARQGFERDVGTYLVQMWPELRDIASRDHDDGSVVQDTFHQDEGDHTWQRGIETKPGDALFRDHGQGMDHVVGQVFGKQGVESVGQLLEPLLDL